MHFNTSQPESHVLLIMDVDSEHLSLITFKSLTIPLFFILTYLLLFIWSVNKDQKDKMSQANIDLKSNSSILPSQGQPQPKPYIQWDPYRTQENWTNVTAMDVTPPNGGITDRIEEGPSIPL